MICQKCGANQPDSQAFCDQCGNRLNPVLPPPGVGGAASTQSTIQCPSCGHTNLPDSNFCEVCGTALAATMNWQPKAGPVIPPPTQRVASDAPVFPAPAPGPINTSTHTPTQRAESPVPSDKDQQPTDRLGATQPNKPSAVSTQRYTPSTEPVPKLVSENGTQITLKPGQDTWLIGREDPVTGVFPDVDLTPFDPQYTASRRHAQLTVSAGQVILTSITRTNWTKINGVRMVADQPTPIKPGDRLEFARVVMIFQY